jgi:hypothetical protein
MDHRISIAIVGVFGAVLGFTFLIASLTHSVGPDRVQAVFGAESTDEPRVEEWAGPSPRELLEQVLSLLDKGAEQWRRDHGGREPDFQTYPDWQQFRQATDAQGNPAGNPVDGGAAGAYFARRPVNPLNGLRTVVVVDRPMRVAERVPSTDGRAGFVYSTADRCYWGTNGTGRVLITRAPEPAASAPQSPANAPASVSTTTP